MAAGKGGGGDVGGQEDKKPEIQTSHITIRVQNQDGHALFFRVKRNVKLQKMMTAYCDYRGVDMDFFVFLFDGCPIDAEQAADEIGLEDGDEIDAMTHQIAGSKNTIKTSRMA